jgi:endonuclease/exonuclease/phosphatase family metal-dependent hydrolase
MRMRLRLVTYNVHRCVGLDRRHSPERIADIVRSLEPDAVALQELETNHRRTGHTHQPNRLAHLLDMDCVYHPARVRAGAQFGNAIFTRLPMRARRSDVLPRHPVVRLQTRGAVWATLRVGDSDFQLINTHLSLLRGERLRQAAALCDEWLAHPDCRTAPSVVCGDFNATPACPTYRKLADGLADAAGHNPHATWPSFLPFRRLDHVFVTPRVTVARVDVPRTDLTRVASDHLPLVVDLEIAS